MDEIWLLINMGDDVADDNSQISRLGNQMDSE